LTVSIFVSPAQLVRIQEYIIQHGHLAQRLDQVIDHLDRLVQARREAATAPSFHQVDLAEASHRPIDRGLITSLGLWKPSGIAPKLEAATGGDFTG
jgi:hypothetical protein